MSILAAVSDSVKLKESYVRAKCCTPLPEDDIVGYFSHDGVLKVHRRGCQSLQRVEDARLVPVQWNEIVRPPDYQPDDDYRSLDATDFRVLAHHQRYGIDYSLKTARVLNLSKQETFDRHQKLRDMKLLERVDATMVQYRKGVVDHKWIKHRNHTYYQLTDRGAAYLEYYTRANNT